ncbi:hypothetical protein ACFL6Q_03600 [Candidatus Neomarinimicrobiota bacterium]
MIEDIEMQKRFFFPVCNQEEIERIFNVQSAADYLLKLRAETIVDHMRLFRVYRNKALSNEENWSLEGSFDDTHYDIFINSLPDDEKSRSLAVTYGNMFSNDPNGSIFKTEYGPIITISDSIRFFLKFSHLAIMYLGNEVPPHVRLNSLRIAIRVMLETEAMDFLMDPRGILPYHIGKEIHTPIPRQMQFIAGHELAHYLLGHVSANNVDDKPIFYAISKNDEDYKPQKVYTQSVQDELEADIQAVLLPQLPPDQRAELIEAALLWFSCLDLYESVSGVFFPRSPSTAITHPSAIERIDNLLTGLPATLEIDKSSWQQHINNLDEFKKFLQDDVSLHFDEYEKYGSAYLDEPNTEWRGRKLIDRVDYY